MAAKFLIWMRTEGGRWLAAAIPGFALSLSFPQPGLAGFAWCAPGLFLAASLGLNGWAAFRAGYVAGLVHALVSMGWLLKIPFPAGAVGGWLALSAYLALFQAVWIWFSLRIFPGSRWSDAARGAELQAPQGWSGWMVSARRLMDAPWIQRVVWGLAAASAWVALEMAQARLLTGFPWNLLGASQHGVLPLVQLASLTGVYGLSALVVCCSLGALCAVLAIIVRVGGRSLDEALGRRDPVPEIDGCRRGIRPFSSAWPGSRRGRPHAFRYTVWLAELLVPGVFLAGIFWWGAVRVARFPGPSEIVKVALVQPSIRQDLIWDRKEDGRRFEKIMNLSRLSLTAKPDLVLWPEAALPSFEEANFAAITNLAGSARAWMIFGADDYDSAGFEGSKVERFYNAAFLLDRHGRFRSVYRKQRLVMFGEYVPLSDTLPFLKYLTPIGSGFTSGNKPGLFELGDLSIRATPLICFEDVFPHSVRESVSAVQADWMVNLTNDGWFGEGSAQWQHAVLASFRAVENGVPLLRCSNNGLTCWVDPLGRLHEVYFGPDRDVYGAGFKIAEVGVWRAGQDARTPYAASGDLFGWSCVGCSALLLSVREFGSLKWRK